MYTKDETTDSDARTYNWFLTINNYTEEELKFAHEWKCDYMIIADEVGEECETPHLHLYFEMKNQQRFSTLKKKFPRANIQPAKGNALQNLKYLSKQNLIYESGAPKKKGERTDLAKAKSILKDTGKMSEVVIEATSYQSVRMCECILKYHEAKRKWKPEVRWYYGETGSGKSRTAYEESGDDVYTAGKTIKWWEGYDGNENIIIDDFRKDFCCFHELLKLLDRYPYRVECKGGSRQLLSKQIIITSAYHPKHIYGGREDIKQLLRRIDKIKLFGKNYNIPISYNGSSEESE